MNSRAARYLPLLALLLLPHAAFAWGCRGHQVIATLAYSHLRPGVAAQVERTLAADPVRMNLRGGCVLASGTPLMVQVSTWADDVRVTLNAGEHYVDIPLHASRGSADYARICGPDCVTRAIANDEATLRGGQANAAARAAALRYLIHYVGDVHQPLHAEDDDDHGGNCQRVQLPGAARPTNLHSIWDTALVLDAMGGEAQSPQAYAATLDRRFPGRRPGSLDPVDWAWQSHALAVTYAYDGLSFEPGCGTHPIVDIPASYVQRATPVVASQLDDAGLRLAAVLNQIFTSPRR